MPRLVVPKYAAMGHLAAKKLEDTPPDDYKGRLVKYVPAESLAFYAFVDKFLISYYGIDASGLATAQPADSLLVVLPWTFLVLGLACTPIYLYRQRLEKQPWKMNASIATIAFLLWAYMLGGSVFVLNGWYHTLVAGIAAPTFTFVAGLFEPKPT